MEWKWPRKESLMIFGHNITKTWNLKMNDSRAFRDVWRMRKRRRWRKGMRRWRKLMRRGMRRGMRGWVKEE